MDKIPYSDKIFYDFFQDKDSKDSYVEDLDRELNNKIDIIQNVGDVLHQAVDDYVKYLEQELEQKK